MDYIRFSVDGQRLDYDRKYYSSTDTIDTLYCNFKFETDDLGHILGGWDLPYLWAQFHDEEGNVYIKPVNDNVCSIPHKCLRQLKFKMTLFATDKEDYMTCEKRYTTNEIAFKFKGRANINYDGGVSPDDPVPTQWQILLDRVDECEDTVDGLSQDVTAIGGRVDGLSQDVSDMGDRVDGIDSRVTANTTAIDNLSQDVTSIHGTLDDLSTELDAETTARETADTRLEGLIDDRYTKTEVDELFDTESTARTNADSNLQTQIDDRYTKAETDDLLDNESTARASADTNLQSQITGVSNDLSAETTARTNGDTNLQSQIDAIVSQSDVVDIVGTYQELVDYDTTHLSENDIVKVLSDSTHDNGKTYYRWSHGAWLYVGTEGATYTKAETDRLINDEATARTSADADLQTQIDNEVTAREKLENEDIPRWFTEESNHRINGDNNLQSNINSLDTRESNHYSTSMSRMDSLDSRITSNTSAIEGINTNVDDLSDTVELLYKTLKKDNSWTELVELVRSGKASQFLNCGDQIEEDWIDVDDSNKAYSNAWDVAKFEDVETREGTIKGMFLKTHWATLKPIQFSHNRAFYACRDGLSAGTYYITLGADWGNNAKKDKSYQFTITKDVPEGGKLAGFYSMPDVVPSNWKVYVYDANGIDILENAIAVTEGTDGTSLGTLKFNTRDGNLNSMQETAYGNNDWEISAYRQYLNSRKGKGEWWTAQDEWDIAPDQLNTVSGFLCGISDELYNSMQTVKVKTWKNNPTHGGVESYTYDKVFLPSKEELYYTPQKAGEGTYYPLMKEQLGLDNPLADYTNYASNITYAIENHNSAQVVLLRSANLHSASVVWCAYASGNVSLYNAASAYRCTPVCVIG